MTLPDPVAAAVPLFAVCVALEYAFCRLRGRADYDVRDSLLNIVMGAGNLAINAVLSFVSLACILLASRFALFEIPLAWWAFAALLLLEDLSFYWLHRLMHGVRYFWAGHVTHHSSSTMNLSVALRQTWTNLLTLNFAPLVVLAWVGFSPEMIAFQKGLSLVYQFFLHTQSVGKLPRALEFVLNTPSHHRVHHATNVEYLDRNLGGMLILWDRLFGTFTPERADAPCRYGIVTHLDSRNPVVVAFHEWADMARDVTRALCWRDRWLYLFGPPGWRPPTA